jgi:hypothetical protein
MVLLDKGHVVAVRRGRTPRDRFADSEQAVNERIDAKIDKDINSGAVATASLRFFRSIGALRCSAIAAELGVSVTVSCALTTAPMRIVGLVGAWRCSAVVDCLGLGVTVCCGCAFATVAI